MRAAEIKSAALIHFLWTETKSNSEYDQRQVQPRKSTARKKGHIIVTSSVAGTRSVPGNAVYAGTKHFVRAMLDSVRAESVMEGTHIRTTLIYPGAIKTELLNTIAPSETKKMVEEFYRNTALESQVIAEAVLYAVSQPDNVDISDLVVRPSMES